MHSWRLWTTTIYYSIYTHYIGDHCIRTSAEDQTNGFFVAVFERMQVATSNSEEVTAATSQFDIREQCCTKIDKTTKTDKATKSKHKKRKRRHFPVTASR